MDVKPIYAVDVGDEYYVNFYFSSRKLYRRYLNDSTPRNFDYWMKVGKEKIRLHEIELLTTEDAFGIYQVFRFDNSEHLEISDVSEFIVKPGKQNNSGVPPFHFEIE